MTNIDKIIAKVMAAPEDESAVQPASTLLVEDDHEPLTDAERDSAAKFARHLVRGH